MQLSKTSAVLVLVYCALVSALPAKNENYTTSKPRATPAPTASITLPKVQIQEPDIKALVEGLNQFNFEHKVSGYKEGNIALRSPNTHLANRSNIPILDQLLDALKKSGLANLVINFVLLSPELLDISSNATIFVLRSGLINFTDVFIALEKSGLIMQILHLSLDDPQILPGLLRITKELLKQNGIKIFNKRSLESDTSSFYPSEPFSPADLDKRESQLMNDLFTSLKDSGLASSIVQYLLTTPDLAAPSATFLTSILRSGAISISEIFIALKESNLIWNLLKDILGDVTLLEKVGHMVADRISKGIIPKSVFDKA